MPVCELCGRDTQLFSAVVEGSELNICASCGKFGRVIQKPASRAVKTPLPKAPEVVEVVVPDFAQRVRLAREKSGMTQKDFAQFLNEKESIVQKLEAGSFSPSISLAKKLEKLLKIELVDVEQDEKASVQKKNSGPLTIGDIINIKK